MTLWRIKLHDEVEETLETMTQQNRKKFSGIIALLEEFGPDLERFSRGKYAHSLKNSRHTNLKELIVKSGKSVLRFAYYIDNHQVVHILCGGDKRGGSEALFYRRLIDKADRMIDAIKRG